MLTPGLVSTTFHTLTIPEVIHLARKSKAKSIEWNGESHLPPGKQEAAQDTRKRTEDAGLIIAAYGACYQIGLSEKEQPDFEEILQTAIDLGAPAISLQAGVVSSSKTDEAARKSILRKLEKKARLAAESEITLSLRFQPNSLNDTIKSSLQIFEEIKNPKVFSLWQPSSKHSPETSLSNLRKLLPHLTNIHTAGNPKKKTSPQKSFRANLEFWRACIDLLRESGREHHILLSAPHDDSPGDFLENADTLRKLLDEESE